MYRRILAEFRAAFVNPITLNIWIVVSVITTVAGPFGTFDSMEMVPRAIFWSGLIMVSLLLSLALAATASVMGQHLPLVVRDGLVVLVFSALFTPIVIQAILWATGGVWLSNMSWINLGFSVVAITAAICVILHQVRLHLPEFSIKPPMTAANSDRLEQSLPRLIRRLEGVSLSNVARLTVEDHYVVVIEMDGTQHRLLMRFGDAVDEMGEAEGYCVHRSHWVMGAAIKDVVKCDGREVVALRNGDMIPVSRTYRQNLIDAGFLQSAPQKVTG